MLNALASRRTLSPLGVSVRRAAAPPSGGLITANLAGRWTSYDGVTDSSGVTKLDDLSGNGQHFTLASTNKPALLASQLNGYPAVAFTGSHYFDTPSWDLAQPITIYAILVDDLGGSNLRFLQGLSTTGFRLLLHTSNSIRWGHESLLTVSGFTTSTWNRGTFIFNGASALAYPNDATPTTGNSGSTGFTGGLRLGANQVGGSVAQFRLVELLLYSAAHDSTDRATTHTYLKTITGE